MKEKKTSELVASIVMGVIGLAFINTVLLWQPYTGGIILPSWKDILWAANLSTIVSILCAIALLCYRPVKFYLFLKMDEMTAALVSAAVFIAVYPFHFGAVGLDWLDTVMKILIGLGIFGSAVGIITNIVRLATNAGYTEKKEKKVRS